jgi:hypothetical protein
VVTPLFGLFGFVRFHRLLQKSNVSGRSCLNQFGPSSSL